MQTKIEITSHDTAFAGSLSKKIADILYGSKTVGIKYSDYQLTYYKSQNGHITETDLPCDVLIVLKKARKERKP